MFLTFTDAGGPEAFSYLVPSLLEGQEDELLSQHEVCLHAVVCFLFSRGHQHSLQNLHALSQEDVKLSQTSHTSRMSRCGKFAVVF